MTMSTNRYFNMTEAEREIVWRRIYNIVNDEQEKYRLERFIQTDKYILPSLEYFFEVKLHEARLNENYALCQAITDAAKYFKIELRK